MPDGLCTPAQSDAEPAVVIVIGAGDDPEADSRWNISVRDCQKGGQCPGSSN